jgi:3-oxoacyl-[acyl-carrier protein] reductase
MLLSGRIALVTGGSRGIGAATARLFAREGAHVAVNYHLSPAPAHALVDEIAARGGRAIAAKADVTDLVQVGFMVQQVEAELGQIDTLVLNAGMRVHVAPFLGYSWEEVEAKVSGELKSVFHLSQAVVPGMVARHAGCIVAVSSTLSRRPGDGFSAHSAGKSAVDALLKSMALELGPMGVRVNVVAPGLTLTDATAFLPDAAKDAVAHLTPLRRNALPEDVAGAILLLASDHARHVTGTYLPVDGGMLLP